MTSTRLESMPQVLKEGVWDIAITADIKAPAVVLNIEFLHSTGFTGSISIDGVPYTLYMRIIDVELILFRPRAEAFNAIDPLFFLFAVSVTKGTGTVVIPIDPNVAPDPDDDLGLEGSWTATTKPAESGE